MNKFITLLALFFGGNILRMAMGLPFVPMGEGQESIKDTKGVIDYRSKINDELISLYEKEEPTNDDDRRAKELEAELKRVDAELDKREKVEQARREQQRRQEAYRTPVTPSYTPGIGRDSSRRDVERFSVPRLLRSLLNGERIDGVEREMMDEGQHEARESSIQLSRNSVMVPSVALLGEKRDMSVSGGTNGNAGGDLVQTNIAPLLDDLFNRNVLVQGGMTTYSGLVGNLDIPRLSAGSDPDHKAETAAADETSPTTSELSLSPKRLPVYADVSRQLFLQSQERNLDTAIRRHIVRQMNEIIQKKLINGSGSGSNEPMGILNTSGIGAVSMGTGGGAPTWPKIVELETEVAVDDADIGSLHYLSNAKVRGKLKSTSKQSSTDSVMILDDRNGGLLNGYMPLWTNGVPSTLTEGSTTGLSAIIFGNFAALVMAQWSGIEFILDEVTQAGSGLIRLHAAIYYDGGVQRPVSFAAAQDVSTS